MDFSQYLNIGSAIDTISDISKNLAGLYYYLSFIPDEWFTAIVGIMGTVSALAIIRWVWW